MDPRPHLIRCAAVVSLCLATIAGAQAQNLAANGSVGLKALSDTSFFDIPLGRSWSVVSHIKMPAPAFHEGLKLDVGGGYGWRLSRRSRLGISAELGLVDDTAPKWTAGEVTGNATTTSAGSSSIGARDLSFNLFWNWRYSESFALTSGLGVRYSLTDPFMNSWAGPTKPSSATGYVGLRYSF